MHPLKVFKNIHPFFILLLLSLILFSPFLFFKKVFSGFDALGILYPYSFHYINNPSLWISSVLSGFDAWAAPSNFAGNWIFYFSGVKWFDFITFYNVLTFFYFVLMIIFSYLASRSLGFDKWVAAVITAIFVWSANVLNWIANLPALASFFMFPAIVYILLKFKHTRNWIWAILGGGLIGFGMIVSHPQFILMAVFGGFLFSLFLAFGDDIKKPDWRVLAVFLIMIVLAAGLASFQLLGEYKLYGLANRGAGLSFIQSQEGALAPLDFIKILIPNFNFYVSGEANLFIGILPLILVILALLYHERNRNFIFWATFLIFILVYSIEYSPLAWIFHQLPVWRGVRGTGRFFILGNFALAVLAGYGFNTILSFKNDLKNSKFFRYLKKFGYFFIFLVVIINAFGLFKDTLIGLADRYFDKYYYAKTSGLALEHYHSVISRIISINFFYSFSFFNRDFLIGILLFVSAFLVAAFIHKFNQKSLALVVIAGAFVWAVFSPSILQASGSDFFSASLTVKFLLSQDIKNFRVYSLMPIFSDYQLLISAYPGATQKDQDEFLKSMLPVYLNVVHSIDSIDGNDESEPARTARILSAVLSERAAVENKLIESKIPLSEKLKIFADRKNLLSMMNVKYIISAYPLDEKIFKKVFETKATQFNIPVYIYENKDVLPRFYFAKNVRFIKNSGDDAILQELLMPGVNFSAQTFIECGGESICYSKAGFADDALTVQYYKNGYLKLKTKTTTEQWLIFSESRSSYWQAKINSKTAPIYTANYLYQAVRVPQGENEIEFIYKPQIGIFH